MTVELSPEARLHLEKDIDALTAELEGLYTRDDIEKRVYESLEDLPQAKIDEYLPVLAHRFARRRLRAQAQSEGRLAKHAPEVLFVDLGNAGLSQLAAGLVDVQSHGAVHPRTGGTEPASELDPNVLEAMKETGVDMSSRFPKPITNEVVRAADVVVTFGVADEIPVYERLRYEDWDVEDPVGKDLETVRRIRDELAERVKGLLATIEVDRDEAEAGATAN
jgi:arsenate reductase (thioredoxin)